MAGAFVSLFSSVSFVAIVGAFSPTMPVSLYPAAAVHRTVPHQAAAVKTIFPHLRQSYFDTVRTVPLFSQRSALLATSSDSDGWETSGTDYGGTTLSVLSMTCVSGGQTHSFGMDVEVLTELLMENGALSCVVEDADYGTERERPIFDEPGQAQSESWLRVPSEGTGDNFWANCNVTAYFAKDFDIPAVVNMVSEAMALPVIPRYSIDLIADRDWVKEVQRGWTPILIDDLVLRFPWHSTGDVAAYLESQGVTEEPHYEVTLEGGMAFGTGEHATTRLCCRWLRRQISKGNSDRLRVMDYGAGSGVLGLAALVYGAAEVAGVEIDPDSIAAAHANAAINNLPAFKCYLPAPSAGAGGGQRSSAAADVALAQQIRDPAGAGRTRSSAQALPPDLHSYDVVVSNILAGPLVRLAPEIARLCRPGGRIGLSGILSPQASRIAEAYAPFFDDVREEDSERGWVLVTGKRKFV